MQYTYFVPRNMPKLTTRGGTVYQSRRCGDDSHPGEEIYTPSGDEAIFHPEMLALQNGVVQYSSTGFNSWLWRRFKLWSLEAPKGAWGESGCHGAKAGATGRKRAPRGESGRHGAETGRRALEDGSGKEGEREWGGAGRQHIDHTAITVMINLSKARRKRQVVDTGLALTNFASILYWRNCTFT